MSAQLAVILADLERHKHCFDLDRDNLGTRLAEATAASIFEYMEVQVGPDNAPWQELSEAYAAWKSRRFPGQPMADLYHAMKSPDQLRGQLQIGAHEMTQEYGLDEKAKQEAVWFQEGNDRQPPRPFYDFNDLTLAYLATVLDERWDSETR